MTEEWLHGCESLVGEAYIVPVMVWISHSYNCLVAYAVWRLGDSVGVGGSVRVSSVLTRESVGK